LLAEGGGVEAGIEDADPLGFAFCEVEVALPDGAEEFERFAFHAIEGACAASFYALQSGFGIEVKQEGAVGAHRSRRKLINGCDFRWIEGAGHPLIYGGGIKVTITEDNFPGIEGGLNDLARKLGTAGSKEEQFCLRTHRLSVGIMLDEVPEGFAEGGAAGFAGQEDFPSARFEVCGKGLDLGGFPATFAAFKTDEITVHVEVFTRIG
jgi:hypothetical protein